MFVESLARIALLVFNNESLKDKYSSIAEKLTAFFTMWNLGDESVLVLHREERSISEQDCNSIVCYIAHQNSHSAKVVFQLIVGNKERVCLQLIPLSIMHHIDC
mgnify:CR=1 FL=1